MAQLAPIDDRARIGVLDVLRAIGLFGIFVVNLESFNRPWDSLSDGMRPGLGGLDVAVAALIQVLVAGKAWLLFSLLFGIGFALFGRGGDAAADVWRRRTWLLLAIGLAHGLLLWPGDILRTYALAGFLLLALRGLPPASKPAVGLVLYVGMWALLGLALAALPDAPDAPVSPAGDAYVQGSYPEVTAQRFDDLLMAFGNDIIAVPTALGVFLIGGWLLATGRIEDPGAHLRWHRAMALLAMPAGLLATIAIVATVGLNADQAGGRDRWMVALVLMQLAALPMSLGFVSAVLLAWRSAGVRRWLGVLAPAGRMALTHYLLQSLLASTLFYGYGLGQWGRWGPAALLLLAATVFALQVLASHWWLARYRFGPAEWLWRWGTYRQRPSLRRAPVAA